MKRERPLMIYDGDCGFCKLWVERFRARTGDRVAYRPAQEVAAEFPEVPAEAFARSVQFIDAEGRRTERAAAVFRALAVTGFFGRGLSWLHARVPLFAAASDGAYDFVARNRLLFSRLTRLLWGRDATPPTYALATAVFLRLLGAVYLIAFWSFGAQAEGLVGAHGILPVREILPQVAEAHGADAWWQWPTLLWLRPEDGMLFALTWAGAICAGLVIAGMVQPLALGGAWLAYLSLAVAGQDFYAFQWDFLLLETGWLAVFAAPCRGRPNLETCAPRPLAHFLLVWLLFRLMFCSGVVKLASGDPAWAGFTALDFYYWTQPIPTAAAWLFAQGPAWVHRLSCGGMFVVELGLPFLVFLPRRPRLVAGAGFVALQGGIALTGNYGFFNLLAVALALLLVDDRAWRGIRPRRITQMGWPKWPLWPLAAAYLLLSLVPLAGAFRQADVLPRWLLNAYGFCAPFRIVNGYGLFAMMTTERPEIELQGSLDGVTWETYEFKYQPGPLTRRPPFVAPYMPRLDWQMWFAALGDVRESRWMAPFVGRLFEARPEVLALLGRDPFRGRPPRFLRANVDDYRFTNFAQWRATGDWWRREPRGDYFPALSRERFER